nr:hypothetical protein [Tanacetum cinerariifolium]
MMFISSLKEEHPRCYQAKGSRAEEKVLDGSFGGVGDEEVVVGEGVMVTSLSLEMKGLKEEALVEFMIEWFEEDEDGKKHVKDDLFN